MPTIPVGRRTDDLLRFHRGETARRSLAQPTIPCVLGAAVYRLYSQSYEGVNTPLTGPVCHSKNSVCHWLLSTPLQIQRTTGPARGYGMGTVSTLKVSCCRTCKLQSAHAWPLTGRGEKILRKPGQTRIRTPDLRFTSPMSLPVSHWNSCW